MVGKAAVWNQHKFEVEINGDNETIFYDHVDVSSEKAGTGRHAFEVEEDGAQVRYEILIEYKTESASGDRPYDVNLRNPRRGSLVMDVLNTFARKVSSIRFAIIRNTDIVYNDGLDLSQKHLKEIRSKLQGEQETKPPGAGVCTYRRMMVSIPNSAFCPNCGTKLETGEITTALPWKEGNPSRSSIQTAEGRKPSPCAICGRPLREDDSILWCPFCGRGTHRQEMLDRLRSNRACPKCGSELDAELLLRYLSR